MSENFGFKVVFNSEEKLYEVYDLCDDNCYQLICSFRSKSDALICISDRIRCMVASLV